MATKNITIFLLLLLITFCSVFQVKAQNTIEVNTDNVNLNWYFTLSLGTQISGIKPEDFVGSNYSPLIKLNVGKWFASYMALAFGYKGYYFNYVGDNRKHEYYFFYGEAIFNINRLLLPKKANHLWTFEVHSGAGYFYNYFYSQPNICASLDLSNKFQINNTFSVLLSASAILGWDIYQGDEDILPGATVGLVYFFP